MGSFIENKRLFGRAAAMAAALVITSCGGSSSGSGDPTEPATTGIVGVTITDAPSDRFEQILATITRIELLGDGEPAIIFEGSEQIDFQQLTSFSELFATAEINTGTYSGISLTLADLILVDLNADGSVAESIQVELPGNGEIEIDPNQELNVVADTPLLVEVDFDTATSFKDNGGTVNFRPALFIRVINAGAEGRLTRIFGRIGQVLDAANFELCQTEFLSDTDSADDFTSEQCVAVSTSSATGFFLPTGEPTDSGSISTGQFATVIGFISGALNDVEPSGSETSGSFDLKAVVTELGDADDFHRLKGSAQTFVGPGREFDLLIDPAQGFGEATAVKAQLQIGSRIYSRAGAALGDSQIRNGVRGLFDGVLTLVNDGSDLFRLALAVIDTDPRGEDILLGTILTPAMDNQLMLATATGDQCVDVPADAGIVVVTPVGDRLVSTLTRLEELQTDWPVDVYGESNIRGCFIADAIIVDQTATPPPANQPPVADAGSNQAVDTGTGVMLDGTGSSDPDGDPLSYSWTLETPAGSAAVLSAADTAMPSLLTDVDGDYVATLVVNDGALDSAPATVTVTASSTAPPANQAPTANAGADQSIDTGTRATLNGAGSSDPDGDPLSYSWTLDAPAGSVAVLSAANSAAPSFTPDVDGTYIATLVVNDGELDSAPDTVTISASTPPPVNQPPVANAGSDRATETGAAVMLDGTGSSDPDGDALNYSWTLDKPAGSDVVLSGSNSSMPTFTPDVEGSYVATLIVNDGELDSAPDTVTVTASAAPPGNQAPTANAGADQEVDTGTPVMLDGTGSSDPNGDALNYSWTLEKPIGSNAILSPTNSAMPGFTPDIDGDYVATLVVSDGELESAPDTVAVTATAPPPANQQPVADAGNDQTVDTGNGVSLDGTGSSDPDGDPLSYSWTLEKPAGSSAVLAAADTAMPSFVTDLDGDYVATLVVNDGELDSAPDAVTVSASTPPPANQPPVANAGPDQDVETGAEVTLDGSGSSDPDENAITYSWSLVRPGGSSSTLTGADTPAPSFVPDVDGIYVATLIVKDGELDSDPDSVTVTATTTVVIDGAQLYADNCQLCHRPLADSEKAGATAAEIQGAIDQGKGGMGSLSFLTSEEVQAIADALNAP